MPDVTVRFAKAEDLESCMAFEHTVKASILERKIKDREVIVAQEAEGILGYCRVDYVWHHIPYIGLIGVRADRRGQGIGKAMLKFCEENERCRGKTKLLISATETESEPQAWHRHMGFKEIGCLDELNDDGTGEIFFIKQLATELRTPNSELSKADA